MASIKDIVVQTVVNRAINSAITSGIVLGAMDGITEGCEKLGDKLVQSQEKREERKIKKFLNKDKDHCHFIATELRDSRKKAYCIYDDKQQIKYNVKSELVSLKPCLHLFNAETGKEIAVVREKLFAVRGLTSLEQSPKDFEIEIGGEKIGVIKTKGALCKKSFQISFRPWRIEGDIRGKNYSIISDTDDIIMKISKKSDNSNSTYFVDIFHPKDQLLGVVILLALDMSCL